MPRRPSLLPLLAVSVLAGCGAPAPPKPEGAAREPAATPTPTPPSNGGSTTPARTTWGPWRALDGGRVSPDTFPWGAEAHSVHAIIDRDDRAWIYATQGDGAEIGRAHPDGRSGLERARAPRVEGVFALAVADGRPSLVTPSTIHRRAADGTWTTRTLGRARPDVTAIVVDGDDRVWALAWETEKVDADPCRGQRPGACEPSPPRPPRWAKVHVGRIEGESLAWLAPRSVDPRDHPSLGVDARGRCFLSLQDEHGALRASFAVGKDGLAAAQPDGAFRFADVERAGRTGFAVLARRGDHVVAAQRVADQPSAMLIEARGAEPGLALGMREGLVRPGAPADLAVALGPDPASTVLGLRVDADPTSSLVERHAWSGRTFAAPEREVVPARAPLSGKVGSTSWPVRPAADRGESVVGADGARWVASTRGGRLRLARGTADAVEELEDDGAPVVADAVSLAVAASESRVCVAWLDRPRFPAVLVRCRDAR